MTDIDDQATTTKRFVFPTFAEAADYLEASGFVRVGADSWTDDGFGGSANIYPAEGRGITMFLVEIVRGGH